MKPILIFCLTIILFFSARAQHFSAGIRTGGSYWMSIHSNTEERIYTNKWYSWSQSVYGRYETNKHFAFELEAMHYGYEPNIDYPTPEFIIEEGPFTEHMNEHLISNTAEYSLSAQYRIGKGKLKNYIGAVFAFSTTYFTNSYDEKNLATNIVTHRSWRDSYHDNYTGLAYYTSYPVNRHLNIQSQIDFKINTSTIFSELMPLSYYPNSKFTWSIGAGYNF